MRIILPLNIEFKFWTEVLRRTLTGYNIPILDNNQTWWDWADQLVRINSFTDCPKALKEIYPLEENWRDWAAFFVKFAESL